MDVKRLPTSGFDKLYPFRYEGYSLEDYASRMLNNPPAGVVVTPRARAHFQTIIKEPIMGKIAAPVKTAPVAPVAVKPAAKVAPAATKPQAVKAPAEEGGEPKAPRNRRDKIDGGLKIKALKANPARVGTMRHAIVETIFAAKTVDEALQSTVTRPKEGAGEYKLGLPDIYFALENELIELS